MIIAPGATSISVDVLFLDDTGAAVTGKVASDFPVAKWSGGTNVASSTITLSDLAAITTAHPNDNTAGGIKEREGGWYRADLPNNMFTSAGRKTLTFAETTNKRIIAPFVDCQYTQADVEQWKGTSLPAAVTAGYVQTDQAQVLPSTPAINSVGEALFIADNLVGRINTAQAGAASTITLDASASSTDGRYVGYGIYLYGGTGGGIRGVGQERTIIGYVGSTKVATVAQAWGTNPDNTTKFMLYVQPWTNVGMWNGTAVSTPATPGIPDINVKNIVNVAATLDANNALNVSAKYWAGTAITATSIPVATAAGASGGLFIAGSNAATTISGLTTGALSCTTITASGAVAFQSTFAVTTSTSLAALSCTTLTASGAVAFQSTFAVTTSTALGAISGSTLTLSGAVAFQSTFIVTGAVTFSSTFATTGTTTFNAFTVTNNMTVSGTTTHTGAVSFGSTFGVTGTTTLNALTVTNATTLSGAVSLGSTLGIVGATTFAAVAMTTLTASGAVAFQSTFAVTTSTSLAALSCTTLTASGAVAFQSTFAVTTSTSLAALSATTVTASGAVAFQSTFIVTGATTLTGAVTATNASNSIVGMKLAASGLDPVLIESSISASASLTDDSASQLTSINARQAISLIMSAAAAGVLAGAATTTITTKPGGLPAGNTRVSATVDASGNRTALTLKVPT